MVRVAPHPNGVEAQENEPVRGRDLEVDKTAGRAEATPPCHPGEDVAEYVLVQHDAYNVPVQAVAERGNQQNWCPDFEPTARHCLLTRIQGNHIHFEKDGFAERLVQAPWAKQAVQSRLFDIEPGVSSVRCRAASASYTNAQGFGPCPVGPAFGPKTKLYLIRFP